MQKKLACFAMALFVMFSLSAVAQPIVKDSTHTIETTQSLIPTAQ